MKSYKKWIFIVLLWSVLLNVGILIAQNPIINSQFTADPSARVFGDRVYVYPSHDILCGSINGRSGWFCMEDYHVFSSTNLSQWTDHGIIISQNNVKWVDSDSYSMWAPDCIYKNGRYYFYFPAIGLDTTEGKRFSIGVAISDNPWGSFTPQVQPIRGVRGIDPNVFIDDDGQAYLYWAMRNIYVAKLKENMLELASEPQIIKSLPDSGLKEGPFMFKRNGTYYLTYPHVDKSTERLEYATGDNPMGPFNVTGVIMDELESGCWTNHQSIIEFKEHWYLFYHNNNYSPHFDKNRSICIDSLFFNDDGTIRKVIPTNRGVGLTMASDKIEIDRYSLKSKNVAIDYIDTLNPFNGWKASFEKKGDWIKYNRIQFADERTKTINIRYLSPEGGTLQIRLDSCDGDLLTEIKIPAGNNWNTINSKISSSPGGIHDLVLISEEDKRLQIDWVRFR